MIANLSKSELEILQTLWDTGTPLTRAQIIDLSPNRSWQDKSFNLIVNNMIEKEIVCIDGFAQSKKNFGRLYAPKYSPYEYLAAILCSVTPHASNEERCALFIDALNNISL